METTIIAIPTDNTAVLEGADHLPTRIQRGKSCWSSWSSEAFLTFSTNLPRKTTIANPARNPIGQTTKAPTHRISSLVAMGPLRS